MDILQFRYFMETAATEHMTKAARKLNISQPSLSVAIKHLEEELGCELFIREKNRIRLSAEGELLKKKLIPILSAIDNIPDEIRHINEKNKTTIKIKLLSASAFFTDMIIVYERKHPEISFIVTQDVSCEDYDITIYTIEDDNRRNENQTVLVNEKFYLCVPLNSDYAMHDELNLIDLQNEKFIGLSKDKQLYRISMEFCRRSGFIPEIIFESDNPESVRKLLCNGMGVGFWPEVTWGEIISDKAVLRPIARPECTRTIVAELGDHANTEVCQSFIDSILAQCLKGMTGY